MLNGLLYLFFLPLKTPSIEKEAGIASLLLISDETGGFLSRAAAIR